MAGAGECFKDTILVLCALYFVLCLWYLSLVVELASLGVETKYKLYAFFSQTNPSPQDPRR
jgi:hypothetical protein